MWRPREWGNPHRIDVTTFGGKKAEYILNEQGSVYEEGADELMKVLRAQGTHIEQRIVDENNKIDFVVLAMINDTVTTLNVIENNQIMYGKNGTIVFIPDDIA